LILVSVKLRSGHFATFTAGKKSSMTVFSGIFGFNLDRYNLTPATIRQYFD